jgi:hypothetical protein
MIKIKSCKICNKEFSYAGNRAEYCSDECQDKERYRRWIKRNSISKECLHCKNKFSVSNRYKHNLKKFCSAKCQQEFYHIEHSEELKNKNKVYRDKNRELINKKLRDYYKANSKVFIKKTSEYKAMKRKTDVQEIIRERLRARIKTAIRLYYEESKIVQSKDFKINYKAIIEHLKPFPEDITKYHIDHIKPLCLFDLTNPNELEKAIAPENHQWLTIKENLSKGGKYEY